MREKKKDEVTRNNGRHAQQIESVTPPRKLNRRSTDPTTQGEEGTPANRLTLLIVVFAFLLVGIIIAYTAVAYP